MREGEQHYRSVACRLTPGRTALAGCHLYAGADASRAIAALNRELRRRGRGYWPDDGHGEGGTPFPAGTRPDAGPGMPRLDVAPHLAGTLIVGESVVADDAWHGARTAAVTWLQRAAGRDCIIGHERALRLQPDWAGSWVWARVHAEGAPGRVVAVETPAAQVRPHCLQAPCLSGDLAVGRSVVVSEGDWAGVDDITIHVRCRAAALRDDARACANGESVVIPAAWAGRCLQLHAVAENAGGVVGAESPWYGPVGGPERGRGVGISMREALFGRALVHGR